MFLVILGCYGILNTVKTLIGKVPVMHLDPVLIFNYDLFMPSNVTLKNYMIVYTIVR